ncbi:MAG: hypothetical protein HGA47_03830 [Zoogloea sp.]|nr:hypothetical protein [Zoogloea sp.]
MKLILAILALVIAVVAAPFFFHPAGQPGSQAVDGLPWQIEPLADGSSRVFGLNLGSSTLGDARPRFGSEMQVAIIWTPDETGAVEAYSDTATMGAVSGKMILTAELPAATVEAMKLRAEKTEYMESTTRKTTLAPADLEAAYAARIRSMSFIPSANLDEEIVLQRFGPPAERIKSSDHVEHFLYPAKGLDLILDSKGKELLQYVPPRDFARLRDPLVAARAK